jgi:uncharacterized membrane protein YccC
MRLLSRRAKEATKTGLAMAIAFGIALAMDWEKPYWAGFAIAMISLSTAGQSLNKGAMRMLGTLLAAAVALTLLALFPQDRWLLMMALSVYLAVCTYMLTGKTRQYFWFVSAFVCVIIIVTGGHSATDAFYAAVERAQETGMGILVYGLIAAFLWPQSSRSDLEDTSRKLVAVQHRLFLTYRDLMAGQGTAETSQPERMQEVRLAGLLGKALGAAETDSYTVWEVRHLWRRFRDDSTALGETLERWREGFPEIQELDLTRLFPRIDAFCDELEARFSAIERILAGEAPLLEPQTVSLNIELKEMRGLSHFQQAAATVTKAQLERVEELSRALFETVRDIKSTKAPAGRQRRQSVQRRDLAIDPDRLVSVLRVIATLWVAFLIWVYIDPPGHALFVQLAVILALVFAMTPQLSPTSIFLPLACGTALAGVLYTFVMPQLSGYGELGLMIFAVTAGIYYLFSQPHQTLAKLGTIVPFVVLISVQNQQTYSFAGYANSAAMIMLAISLVIVMAYIPTSPRPEKVFLRLFARFFRQVDSLLLRIALDWEQTAGVTGRLKASYYSGNLLELSQKLAAYGPRIDSRSFPDNPPAKVQALVTSLGALAFRMKELVEARDQPQAELVVRELLDDLRAWRLAILQQISLWAEDPEAAARQATDLQDRLNQRLVTLEARIEEIFLRAGEGELDAQDFENLYRLLGTFRGLSEAGVAFVGIARDVNWGQWREARF